MGGYTCPAKGRALLSNTPPRGVFGTIPNSVNFKARTSRFGMEVDLHYTYNMILMKIMIMTIMMMKMIIAVTQ